MIELHLHMIERWGGLQCISETTDAFTLGSTALGLDMDICKDQEMEFNHDMPVTENT